MVDRGGTTQRFAGALAGIALVLAVTGCRAATQPTASPSAVASSSVSPTASPTVAPSQTVIATSTPGPAVDSFGILPGHQPDNTNIQITCPGTIGGSDSVAVVQLRGTGGQPDYALRDYADVSKPRTVCEMNQPIGLLDAHHLLYDGGRFGAVIEVPEVRIHWFELPVTPGWGSQLITVSPNLDEIVWKSIDPQGSSSDTIHITTTAGDKVVATLRDTNEGRCGSPDDSKGGEFTAAGDLLYVLNQPLAQQASLLVVKDRKVIYSVLPPTGEDWPSNAWPAMAVWSPTGDTLYYRQGTDVWKWTGGATPEKFLADVAWHYPTISPDRRFLAYAMDLPDNLHDVYLVDLAHEGSPQKIGPGAHNYPIFLNNTQLWLMAEKLNTGCADSNEQTPMVYNVITGSQGASIIDWVFSAWPATSSNW